MTKVSYNIIHNGRIIKNVIGYQEAVNICEELGSDWRFAPVYTEYNPNHTPKYIEACKVRTRKFAEAIKARALA